MRYYSSVAGKYTLSAGITADDTSVTLDSSTGLPASTPFTLILDYGEAFEEIITVTAVSGGILTVVRAQDGTTARTHDTGAVVRHGVTARDLREPQEHINATANVHGITGDVVGTTDVQTLQDKTFTPKTVDSVALKVNSLSGQNSDLFQVNATSGEGFFRVDKNGNLTVTGEGTGNPITVKTRGSDDSLTTRFTVGQSGNVFLGAADSTQQPYISWTQQVGADVFERRTYVSNIGELADVLFKNGTEISRTSLGQQGMLKAGGFQATGTFVFTNKVTARSGYAIVDQQLTKFGPLVTVSMRIGNRTGADIASGSDGSLEDIIVADISDESYNPSGMAATGRFVGYGGTAGGGAYIATNGAITISDIAASTWTKGTDILLSFTYRTDQ